MLDGYDQNCYDTDDGRICHEMYMSFDDNGGYSMRVETRSVETGERYTSYSYDGRYTVGADGALTTCDRDMRACEEMSYQIRGDEMILSGMMDCTGTMKFERVKVDRHFGKAMLSVCPNKRKTEFCQTPHRRHSLR